MNTFYEAIVRAAHDPEFVKGFEEWKKSDEYKEWKERRERNESSVYKTVVGNE